VEVHGVTKNQQGVIYMQRTNVELNAEALDEVAGGATVAGAAKAVGRVVGKALGTPATVVELGWEALKALTALAEKIDKDLRKNGHPTNGNLEGS
jgi:hypothetical protein